MREPGLLSVVAIIAASACQQHATFLAIDDLPVVERPLRSSSAPNRVVGVIRSGDLIQNAPVIKGMDYRYYEVRLGDGGVGYVRPSSGRKQIYLEE